mmetsp:Transcript_24788/g.69044  ORF Transcript_24788/g.69044 Transcript_24788/m.69044 type:complete len:201 (-) Transcript_24788:1308-1910(-)
MPAWRASTLCCIREISQRSGEERAPGGGEDGAGSSEPRCRGADLALATSRGGGGAPKVVPLYLVPAWLWAVAEVRAWRARALEERRLASSVFSSLIASSFASRSSVLNLWMSFFSTCPLAAPAVEFTRLRPSYGLAALLAGLLPAKLVTRLPLLLTDLRACSLSTRIASFLACLAALSASATRIWFCSFDLLKCSWATAG